MRNATVEIHCPICGKTHYVEVNESAYWKWQDGILIQNAMPELTPTEREQLISGICPKCQEFIFAPPPEPEDDGEEPCDGNCTDCPRYAECYADEAPDDLEMGFDPYLGCYTDDC